ncbi:putative sperimidine/putrescine transport protein (ABC superfamily, atp_bind) [Bradyrhizobium sp. STM 3843]|uniref:ABC transporter ATP-binding protein n=1 Tax=Bradyrhizobium sp. STM 3843 TaxID=551947 RepID=UPI000240340C|nr:ABC transporter ATP-binding protein [Bradyrhizobium sp. STM 3843]CCE09508.1 putative sperimidine/putrescine transport protein (ABC superfamily, atp_bind) [Bradyrhizobium sp. STM 3843]
MSAGIEIAEVSKVYEGGVRAVDAVAMEIRAGEFFSLLGPSGCGKTTTLRMIAGFDTPSSGEIRIDGADITRVPAHKRDMAMVFQNYALFPHRTVAENVGFGLRMRKLDKATIAAKVKAALAMVELSGMDDRRPAQLSGGQQQRVALARAIVIEPRVLLCDEPLGALDKKLRQQMQFELKQLQRNLGLTLVFVTHDQEEALAMSDRIAVMNAGRVEQVGTPVEIYDRPQTRFVADFIGDTNIFRGQRVTVDNNGTGIAAGNGLVLELPGPPAAADGAVLSVALRPEKIRLAPKVDTLHPKHASANGTVESTNFLGGAVLYRISLDNGHRVLAQQPNAGAGQLYAPGAPVMLGWTPADLVILKD